MSKTLLLQLVVALVTSRALRATYYESPTLTVKLTRRHKPNRRARSVEFVLTIGAPNYAERQFIKLAKRAGEKFPVRKAQLKFYPKGKR